MPGRITRLQNEISQLQKKLAENNETIRKYKDELTKVTNACAERDVRIAQLQQQLESTQRELNRKTPE